MKKRVLLTSLLTIVLCFSLITGATYALFTSEDEVNIAVTSGKVEVVATVSKIELYSMDVLQSDKFENGGTATVDQNQLKLDKMTPGDKAVVTIKVDNNSNVNTLWRFVYECVDGIDLMSGMIVSINDTEYGALKAYNSAWATLNDEYQGLTANTLLKVEAVQGNAGYTDAESVSYIAKAGAQSDLNEAIANGAKTVLLEEGTF